MKKFVPGFAFVLIAISVVFFTGKNSNNKNDKTGVMQKAANVVSEANEKYEADDCCKAIKSEKYSDESIYLLNGKWTDQNKKIVRLGDFKNKNVVLAMFFASCQSACPVIVNDMKIIEASIPANKKNNYMFVLVSIDPARDTPDVLANYAKERNLDKGRWCLLTGGKDDIMELSMILGFKFTQNESGGFTHTNLISFLNHKGEIVFQNEGLGLEKDSVTKVIASLN